MLNISDYTTIFAVISNTYGGNGYTEFALPDLRARIPLGSGNGPGIQGYYQMGQRGGVEVVSLRLNELPTHSHSATPDLEATQTVSKTTATDVTPDNNSLLAEANYQKDRDPKQDVKTYTSDTSNPVHLKANDVDGSIGIGNTGGSQPHENRQPFNTVNFMICITGYYPSPN